MGAIDEDQTWGGGRALSAQILTPGMRNEVSRKLKVAWQMGDVFLTMQQDLFLC